MSLYYPNEKHQDIFTNDLESVTVVLSIAEIEMIECGLSCFVTAIEVSKMKMQEQILPPAGRHNLTVWLNNIHLKSIKLQKIFNGINHDHGLIK